MTKETKQKTGNRKAVTVALAAVIGLPLLLLVLCCRYDLRNRELAAENQELSALLADKDRVIEDMTGDMEQLQERLAAETCEYETETGYIKRGDVYFIDTAAQLVQLQQMIEDEVEIEPGVAAAEASYRLRQNLELWDWFYVGTEEKPFCGSFDGDGHSISGKFLYMDGMSRPGALFRTSQSAQIENLQVINNMDQSFQTRVSRSVEDQDECEELLENLAAFPNCSLRLRFCNVGMDTGEIAEELHDRWERNQEQDGYFLSVNIYSDTTTKWQQPENFIQDIMTPFNGIAGDAYREIIEEAMEKEEGYLTYLQLKRIGELNYCSFEIGQQCMENPQEDDGYYIILEGKWEGKEVPLQHFYIPYTRFEDIALSQDSGVYQVEDVDLDFDGKRDLLIHEGYSGGSGGSWSNYRAIVWREQEGRFALYSSFPEQVSFLELDRQRVIDRGSGGWAYEYVTVYGVVDGEYEIVQELIDEMKYSEEKQDYIHVLSYYEMGELVRTHILEDWEERERLYPDLNYWMKG